MRSTSTKKRTWSYPPGLRVWEVAASPSTPAWALLELPVLDYRTLEAMASGVNPSSRTPEVLDWTIRLLPSADTLAWQADTEPADRVHWGKEHIASLLLDLPELSSEQLLTVVRYTDPAAAAPVIAAHRSTTPRVVAALVRHALEWGKRGVTALTVPGMPDAVRIAAAVCLTLKVSTPDGTLDLLTSAVVRLAPLHGAADTAVGLYPDWSERPLELVNLVERLCS